ncbi:MAG: sulfotransferase [Actinomycetota bacterium]
MAGWGRSGSTIIDNILGEIDGFFSGGEIHYLWERGLIEGRKCGCGLSLSECPVWAHVLERLRISNPAALANPAEVVGWQEDSVRVRHAFGLARKGPERVRANSSLDSYTRLLGKTYAAVAAVTAARVIVDSSKRPSDGAALQLVPGIAPYFVHLVRDPRAVAYSWRRRKAHLDRSAPTEMRRHGAADSTLSWVTWNAAIERLRGVSDRAHFMLLRYEDFVAHPRGAIEAIVRMVGEGQAVLPFENDNTVRLSGNHTISGNPSRFSTGSVALRSDDEWTRMQSFRDRALATSLALPLLRRYGYPLRREAAP